MTLLETLPRVRLPPFDLPPPSYLPRPNLSAQPYPSPQSDSRPLLPDTAGTELHRADSFDIQLTVPLTPPLRTALSATGSTGIMVNGEVARGMRNGSDVDQDPVLAQRYDDELEEGREDLTTKGRKRKRLAKACSACHKNKRRCDGFAPCSNCEFSSRPCLYLNAQGEPIPPPRMRDASQPHKSGNEDTPIRGSSDRPSNENGWKDSREEQPRKVSQRWNDVCEVVERDMALSAELIELFFARLPPYRSMFHLPTFHHRLYLRQTSPLLLDMIYAFSCRLSSNAALTQCSSPSVPHWARGDPFAERACSAARRTLYQRASWSDDERHNDRGSWEETEFVQTLRLLGIYYAMMRQREGLDVYFLDAAFSILRPVNGSLPALPRPAALSSLEHATLAEVRNRTLWHLIIHDMLAAAQGHPRRIGETDFRSVPLPCGEVEWSRFGGAGLEAGRETMRGTTGGSEVPVGELGHLIKILSVYSDIMASTSSAVTAQTSQLHELALKCWASSLPPHLRFDEFNLSAAVARIVSPVATLSSAGWMFAFMHCLAESGMFYLQAAAGGLEGGRDRDGSVTAQRQGQAVDNINIIFDAIGERGRNSCMMVVPLVTVSKWQEHVRSSAIAHVVTQSLQEERLTLWWSEQSRLWGNDGSCMSSEAPYGAQLGHERGPPLVSPCVAMSSPVLPPPNRGFALLLDKTPGQESSLGLYHPTSPPHVPNSAASTVSSIMLPTPVEPYQGRFPHQSLPPLRPQTTSSLMFAGHSPSPHSLQRQLPAILTDLKREQLSGRDGRDDRNGVEKDRFLPPLDIGFRFKPLSSLDSSSVPRVHGWRSASDRPMTMGIPGFQSPRGLSFAISRSNGHEGGETRSPSFAPWYQSYRPPSSHLPGRATAEGQEKGGSKFGSPIKWEARKQEHGEKTVIARYEQEEGKRGNRERQRSTSRNEVGRQEGEKGRRG